MNLKPITAVLLLSLSAAPAAFADTIADDVGATTSTTGTVGDTTLTTDTRVATSMPAKDDTEFFRKAAEGGMAEVELGRLGATQATHPEVRAFSTQMVTDHSAANDKLKALALKKGIALPSGPNADQQQALAEIRAKKGDEFDEHLMKRMVADHDEAVDLFERTAKNAVDADVRNFASQTLPTLKHHEKMADEIEEKVD